MNERNFEKPVAWLLGKQLLGGIKGMLLYTAYGAKLDPRDWMTAKEIPFDAEGKDEFWFDYLSDAGDGSKAMYSIAYLAMTSLWTKLDNNTLTLPDDENKRQVTTLKSDGKDFTFELPRGRFLFIGGDTCYHSAEYLSLVDRFQRPFVYAYQDLKKRKLIDETHERRPIFGIPGNHDYYDQVDGFRRQFRKPTRPEGPLPPDEGPYKSGRGFAALTLAGFKRMQEASYVALRLPFNWWFWGLDTEPGLIDLRQKEFFATLKTNGEQTGTPKKLIVATCSPSTVFGRVADLEEIKATKSLIAVGLDRPPYATRNGGDKPNLSKTGDAALDPGQCRLDLSGDVHHYARYWGPKANGVPRKKNTAERPAAKSYASVVSGAGGAFHHPSTTYGDEICEQVLYPPEDHSREAVGNTLFKFWNVMNGGYIWLAGFIMAFIFYFCITAPQSSRQFITNIGPVDNNYIYALDVTRQKKAEPMTPTIVDPDAQPCAPVKPFRLWSALGLVPTPWQAPGDCSPTSPVYLFSVPETWKADLILGDVFIVLSVVAIALTFYLAVFTGWIFSKKSPWEDNSVPEKKLIPIIAITGALVLIALLSIQPYRDHITPFVNSLLVLYSIAAAVTAIMLNLRYSEYLFKKSFVPKDKNAKLLNFIQKYFLPWVLWLLAIAVLTVGLWFFGKNNLTAYLLSDIIFVVVLLAATIGIMLLPFKVAGDLLYTKPKWVQVIGKAAIGVWFLILQLFVPLILILNANWLMLALAAILVVAPIPLAQFLFKRNYRFALTLLWLVYGAVMLGLPWITKSLAGYKQYPLIFTDWHGWWALIPAILAGAIGAVICCLWTGWYFAVTFLYNGHNNEVGGTARVENFKQFIRFRLTNDSLTGYVIAVDDVSIIDKKENGRTLDGSDLKVRLIDVFHLVPKPAAVAAPKAEARTPVAGARL